MKNGNLVAACKSYNERLLALSLIKQINQMCRAIQRHRGLGMSLIAGYQEFEPDFLRLQAELGRRMSGLRAFAEQNSQLLPALELEKLSAAWKVIERDWQGDSVMENFEYHSHFIEQLLQLMMNLARKLERPAAQEFADAEVDGVEQSRPEPRRSQFSYVGLLVFVCNQLPALIELVAKIRGLSTLAASRGRQEPLESSKLRYFIQGTRAQHEKVRTQADRLIDITDEGIASLPMIKAYEFKLMFLISTVEKEVLSPRMIRMNSRQLFDLATEIIDVYLKVVDEGTSLLLAWQEEDLESWFTG